MLACGFQDKLGLFSESIYEAVSRRETGICKIGIGERRSHTFQIEIGISFYNRFLESVKVSFCMICLAQEFRENPRTPAHAETALSIRR